MLSFTSLQHAACVDERLLMLMLTLVCGVECLAASNRPDRRDWQTAHPGHGNRIPRRRYRRPPARPPRRLVLVVVVTNPPNISPLRPARRLSSPVARVSRFSAERPTRGPTPTSRASPDSPSLLILSSPRKTDMSYNRTKSDLYQDLSRQRVKVLK